MRPQLGLKDGDAVFFVARAIRRSSTGSRARPGPRSARELNLVEKDRFEFCWITDFPMYEWNEDEKKIDFSHNPFSMPQGELAALEAARRTATRTRWRSRPSSTTSSATACELSSGAIRNHKPDIMYKAFEIAGYGPEVVDAKFGGMIRALQISARRRTAASPRVSTASSCCSAAPTTCAM